MLATKTWFGALAVTLLLCAIIGSAHAQVESVWVSRSGSNMNDCFTPATACRFFGPSGNGALSKVVAGGTIHVLPGTYDSPILTESIQIIAESGAEPEVTATTSAVGGVDAAFVIDAGPNDVIRIRGMIVDPTGLGSSIALIAGGALHVENCTLIASNERSAIEFAPAGASELYVSSSRIAENGAASAGSGILIRPTGSGSAKVVVDNVSVENNFSGILIDGRATTGSNTLTIRNSLVSGNSGPGIYSAESGAGVTNIMIEGSTSSGNGQFGIGSNGVNSTVRVRNSTVTGNATGLQVAGSGKVISHGGNVVAGNTTNGAFTQTLPQQ